MKATKYLFLFLLALLLLFVVTACEANSAQQNQETDSSISEDNTLDTEDTGALPGEDTLSGGETSGETELIPSILDLTDLPFSNRTNVTLEDIRTIYQKCEQLCLQYKEIIIDAPTAPAESSYAFTVSCGLTEEEAADPYSKNISDLAKSQHLRSTVLVFYHCLRRELSPDIFVSEIESPHYLAKNSDILFAHVYLNTDKTELDSKGKMFAHYYQNERQYDIISFCFTRIGSMSYKHKTAWEAETIYGSKLQEILLTQPDTLMTIDSLEEIDPVTPVLDLTDLPYSNRTNVTLQDIQAIYQECEQLCLKYETILISNPFPGKDPDRQTLSLHRTMTKETINAVQTETIESSKISQHLDNVQSLFYFKLQRELSKDIFVSEIELVFDENGHTYKNLNLFYARVYLNADTTDFSNRWEMFNHYREEQRRYDILSFCINLSSPLKQLTQSSSSIQSVFASSQQQALLAIQSPGIYDNQVASE